MVQVTPIRLTPAQRRFLEQFDLYTAFGQDPKEYHSLRDIWHIQHRTMNWCHKVGILQQVSISKTTGNPKFIINPALRALVGLPARKINMERFTNKAPKIIKCNISRRRRKSAVYA